MATEKKYILRCALCDKVIGRSTELPQISGVIELVEVMDAVLFCIPCSDAINNKMDELRKTLEGIDKNFQGFLEDNGLVTKIKRDLEKREDDSNSLD